MVAELLICRNLKGFASVIVSIRHLGQDMLRDLLVHIDGNEAGRRRLQLSIGLARGAGARLTGLHVTPPPDVEPLYKPSQLDQAVANLARTLAEDACCAETIFADETAMGPIDARWFAAEGDIVQGIGHRARYADLVILGQHDRQGPHVSHPLPIAHSVVVHCGRPVLVVPANVGPCQFARIGIAWDGSREAVRAVHDALPLLGLAGSVEIITINPSPAAQQAEDTNQLREHLARYGVISLEPVAIETGDEAAALREQTEKASYDLLVMGGYSHPMWLEFILGGTTKSVLRSSKIPVLVSH
ncbi:universal stress protein [Bradyrhizobium sp. B124]|uniref:universal stress protein n=1 Tax=Bradyrhizobium sp. B124 TaxID=3140245 RepID=UPI003182D7E6